jgi:hypothetical protein
MSCVAGLVHKGKVYLGGDSAATGDDWSLTRRADPKVFQKGDLLIGCTGSLRITQLLRLYFIAPDLFEFHEYPEEIVIERYITWTIVGALQTFLKSYQISREEWKGVNYLIGYRGRLFAIYEDWQVEESVTGYNAIGAAAPVALGALHMALDVTKPEITPINLVLSVLQAAEEHHASVRNPFTILGV